MRKKHTSNVVEQLVFTFEEAELPGTSTEEVSIRSGTVAQPVQTDLLDKPVPVSAVIPLQELTDYSRATMIKNAPHDNARRAWLGQYEQERGYPKDWFSVRSESRGWYQACVQAGAEAWKDFLEHGAPFDVYCFFMSNYACTVMSDINEMGAFLPNHLNDAGERGEVALEDIKWTGYKHFG